MASRRRHKSANLNSNLNPILIELTPSIFNVASPCERPSFGLLRRQFAARRLRSSWNEGAIECCVRVLPRRGKMILLLRRSCQSKCRIAIGLRRVRVSARLSNAATHEGLS
jgi:hypothetical protein